MPVVAVMVRYDDNPTIMEYALGRIFEVVKAVTMACDIV
jgi:hypothetical protein